MIGVDLIDLAKTIEIWWHCALFKYKLTFILVLCRTANCSYNISFIYSVYGSRLAGRLMGLGGNNLKNWSESYGEWVSCRVVWDQSKRCWPVGWPTPHNSFWYAVASGTLGKTFMLEVIVWIQIFWVLQVLYITINYNGKTIRHW